MKKARKSIVIAMLAVPMLTCLSGCMTTGSQAVHPFTNMFQEYDPLALNSPPELPLETTDTQQTAAVESTQSQTQF